MSELNIPSPVLYDTARLAELTDLWVTGTRIASPLFLAMNIMDFTGRVRRHLDVARTADADEVSRARVVFAGARELIQSDARIGTLVFEHLSFDVFHGTLDSLLNRLKEGLRFPDEPDDDLFDIVDHFFGIETVLETAETLLDVPGHIKDAAARFRNAFAHAVDTSMELAEAARNYADAAPGGPEMPPWPDLLDTAPDSVYDALLYHELHKKPHAIDEASPGTSILRFTPDQNAARSIAAADDDSMRRDAVWKLHSSDDFSIRVIQDNDRVAIEITGDPLELLPELEIYIGGELQNVTPEEFNVDGCIHYDIGSLDDIGNRRIEIAVPGTDILISLKTSNHDDPEK